METGITRIVENYCPIVGRNVAVEQSLNDKNTCCLNAHACQNEYGGCKNKLFNKETT